MGALRWSQRYATQIPLRRACDKEHSWLTISSYCSLDLAQCSHWGLHVTARTPSTPRPVMLPHCSWAMHMVRVRVRVHLCLEEDSCDMNTKLKNFPWGWLSQGCPAVGGSSYTMSPPSLSFSFHKCQACIALCKFITPNPAPGPLYPSQACLLIHHLLLNECCLSLRL